MATNLSTARSGVSWRLRITALGLILAACAGAMVLRARAADDTADVERLAKALDLQKGMTVAEIGAGDGSLSIAVARRVGSSGRVLTSELGGEHVSKLRQAVEKSGAGNVTVVESAATETRLPQACCDAIFMRDVYHHFGDPSAMNASLRASLKPCGRLAIIDFAPPNGKESSTPSGRSGTPHGVTRATLQAELDGAGFEVLQAEATTGRNFLIVAQRPGADGQPPGPCRRTAS